MLVVHPNSTCDVCLDNYASGAHSPHSIPCGHVFCHGCLDSLPKLICPLCRTEFDARDIRKLHIDRAQTPRIGLVTSTEPTSDSEVESTQGARKYQSDITRIVKHGAPASDLRALIDKCHIWLKTQPHEEHEDLRVSFLLLYNLTETQRKLAAETETIRELQEECGTLQTRIDTEREAAEQKYLELERSCADEKETALAVEKSLRDHYEKLNGEWKSQYDAVYAAWKRLDAELKEAKHSYSPLSEAPRSVDIRYFYAPAPHMDTSGAGEQHMNVDMYGDANLSKFRNEDMFHLSPLPVNIPPLASAIPPFSALAEDEDDVNRSRDKPMSFGQKLAGYGQSLPRSSIQPIPIPKKNHAPRVSSGLVITVPDSGDLWGQGTPQSFPPGYDIPMGSCSTSPVGTSERSTRHRPSPPPTAEIKETSPVRQYAYDGEHEEHERGHQVDQRDYRRVQLHDLLDNQRSSSLPTNSQLRSILSSDVRPSHTRSYSMHSASPTTGHFNPSPSPSPSTSSKPSPATFLNQNHSNRSSANLSRATPPISHASSAAIQLERERLRAEKEREREASRERERDRRLQVETSTSLRDSTNAHHRMGNISNGKARVQVYT